MNGTAELLDSPSPLLVDLVLLADKEDREPILSPETLEVDENELLVIVVGERETYHNPEIQRESLSLRASNGTFKYQLFIPLLPALFLDPVLLLFSL